MGMLSSATPQVGDSERSPVRYSRPASVEAGRLGTDWSAPSFRWPAATSSFAQADSDPVLRTRGMSYDAAARSPSAGAWVVT
eukprot:2864550-Amphidinium_carterae.1